RIVDQVRGDTYRSRYLALRRVLACFDLLADDVQHGFNIFGAVFEVVAGGVDMDGGNVMADVSDLALHLFVECRDIIDIDGRLEIASALDDAREDDIGRTDKVDQ